MDIIKRNNISISGRGSIPMIFSHGFGCDQNMWRLVAPAFADNFKLILYDHVGSGKSDLEAYDFDKYDSLQGYADDLLEICQALKLQDVIFVGHSVSAMIGVLAANKVPHYFRHLILLGPSPCYFNHGDYLGGFEPSDIEGLLDMLDDNYLNWSNTMTPVIMGNPDRPELTTELNNSFCQSDPDIARHFARVTFTSDNREDLEKVSIPSLILQCSSDVIAPEAVGRFVHRQIENSRFEIMNATGHCPNLSAPEETIAMISAYLETRLAHDMDIAYEY